MPWANGLFSPINNALAKDVKVRRLKPKSPLASALRDARTMTKLVADEPTNLHQVVPKFPDVVVFVDASKEGAGGTVYSMNKEFEPFTFRVPFPEEIQRMLEKQVKGNTNVTNSDLEALGCVIAFLVVSTNVEVKNKTMAIFCDNTPTVNWVRKLSSKSKRAARLMRTLALAMKAAGVSPLITLSIAGSSNKEADFASRHIFLNGKMRSNTNFLILFNKQFPTEQGFNLAQLSPKLTSRVTSEMLTEQSRIEFWLNPRRYALNTGNSGFGMLRWQDVRPTSTSQHSQSYQQSKDSPSASVLDIMAKEGRLRWAQYSSRFLPSARPLFWRDTPYTTR